MAETSSSTAVDVNFEDQQNVNLFSRLNARLHELNAEIQAKKASAADYEDAGNELMLADEEDDVRYVVGECFVHFKQADAEERVQSALDALQLDITGLQKELEDVMSKMAALKQVLYKKFGNAINLEE